MTATQKALHESFEISPESPSGLVWRVRPRHHFIRESNWKLFNRRFAGKTAGSLSKTGTPHWQVDTRSNSFRKENAPHNGCHEIIFILTYGDIPEGKVIDHINGNSLDNRIENFRLASFSQNVINTPKRKGCASELKGAHRNGNHWMSKISIDGKRKYLGTFRTQEEAHAAYAAAAKELHKEFARIS